LENLDIRAVPARTARRLAREAGVRAVPDLAAIAADPPGGVLSGRDPQQMLDLRRTLSIPRAACVLLDEAL